MNLSVLFATAVCVASLPSSTRSGVGWDSPSYVLGGNELRVKNAALVTVDGAWRGADLERGQALMNMERLAIPYAPGSDLVWSLEPGDYSISVLHLKLPGERSEVTDWSFTVGPPSRSDRIAALLQQYWDARTRLEALDPSPQEYLDAAGAIIVKPEKRLGPIIPGRVPESVPYAGSP